MNASQADQNGCSKVYVNMCRYRLYNKDQHVQGEFSYLIN